MTVSLCLVFLLSSWGRRWCPPHRIPRGLTEVVLSSGPGTWQGLRNVSTLKIPGRVLGLHSTPSLSGRTLGHILYLKAPPDPPWSPRSRGCLLGRGKSISLALGEDSPQEGLERATFRHDPEATVLLEVSGCLPPEFKSWRQFLGSFYRQGLGQSGRTRQMQLRHGSSMEGKVWLL